LGYNADLPNRYNFEAKSDGSVFAAKNFKLGYQTDSSGNGYYAVEISNTGKLKLTSRGANTRLDIDGDGVISFKNSSGQKLGLIQYSSVRVPVLYQTNYDSDYEIPDSELLKIGSYVTQKTDCLNFHSDFIAFTGGDVSVQKNLTAKTVSVINNLNAKKIIIQKGGDTYFNFSSSGGRIG